MFRWANRTHGGCFFKKCGLGGYNSRNGPWDPKAGTINGGEHILGATENARPVLVEGILRTVPQTPFIRPASQWACTWVSGLAVRATLPVRTVAVVKFGMEGGGIWDGSKGPVIDTSRPSWKSRETKEFMKEISDSETGKFRQRHGRKYKTPKRGQTDTPRRGGEWLPKLGANTSPSESLWHYLTAVWQWSQPKPPFETAKAKSALDEFLFGIQRAAILDCFWKHMCPTDVGRNEYTRFPPVFLRDSSNIFPTKLGVMKIRTKDFSAISVEREKQARKAPKVHEPCQSSRICPELLGRCPDFSSILISPETICPVFNHGYRSKKHYETQAMCAHPSSPPSWGPSATDSADLLHGWVSSNDRGGLKHTKGKMNLRHRGGMVEIRIGVWPKRR